MGVVLFKAAFHGKSPFPSQAGKGLSTPYKEIGQQKSAVRRQTARLTLILRSQKKQDPGLDNPSFFRQYISQKTTILSHEKL